MAQPSVDVVPIPAVCIPKTEPCEINASFSDNVSLSSLQPLIPFTAPNKLKDPIVVLERCDKIWNTLTLIKKKLQTTETRASQPAEKEKQRESDSSSEKDGQASYVTYQPMLVNDNSALPDLRISVKNRKKLFHCLTCGKQYSERRSVRNHSLKIHGIIIPLKRLPRRSKARSESDKVEVIPIDEEPTATATATREKEASAVVKLPASKTVTEKELTANKPTATKFQASKVVTQREQATVSPVQADPLLEKIKLSSQSKPKSRSLPQVVRVDAPSQKRDVPEKEGQVTRRSLPEDPRQKLVKERVYVCVLCQRSVPSIRNHLVDYHKIECPDSTMIQQFGKTIITETGTSSPQTSEARRTSEESGVQESAVRPMKGIEKNTNEDKKRKFPTVMIRPRKKARHSLPYIPVSQNKTDQVQKTNPPSGHKVTGPPSHQTTGSSKNHQTPSPATNHQTTIQHPDKVYQCDICYGVYSSRPCLNKHRLHHRRNGETKEKLHLFAFRYRRSPYYTKPKDLVSSDLARAAVVPPVGIVGGPGTNSDEPIDLEKLDSNDDKSDSSSNNGDSDMNVCTKCGKSFRHAHTLHVHKKNCKKQDDSTEDARSGSDRDSGIGINITIKKKNNSYEIVGKDDEQEGGMILPDNLMDDPASDLSGYTSETLNNTLTKDKDFGMLESSKYSRGHSVLKLEFVEEDVDVDIEAEAEDPKEDPLGEEVSSNLQKDAVVDTPTDDLVECVKSEALDLPVETTMES